MSLCLIILFLGLMSTSVTYAENLSLVKQWGSEGTGDGQFKYPTGIAVDSSGNVYVADMNNHCIQKFDNDGNFITKWGSKGSGNGQLCYPQGVAVDSSGNVYVADTVNDRIEKFDSNGKYITQWSNNGIHGRPSDIAVDSSGNVYVACSYDDCIKEYNSNGKLIRIFSFYRSWEVAVAAAGNVYAVDSGHHLVAKFDNKGNFITEWGSKGSGNGQFNGPSGADVDSSDNVYVIDRHNFRIQKFDSNGNFITNWDSYDNGSAELDSLWDIAIDSKGNMFVTADVKHRIQKFAPVYPPVTNFVSNVNIGYAPLTVKFTDKSTGTPFSWTWNFGDGTSSTVKNPTHTYSKAGKYTVKLTATNEGGNSTATKTNYITVKTATLKPVAIFSASPTSGKAPLTVKFTDKSTGSPTKWKWNFGDETTSTKQSPTHKYSKAGKYTVTLTVSNAAGSNTVTKTNYITVVAKPVAAFSASPTSGKAPLTVKFTDKSTGSPAKWKWNFGDGSKSFLQNPTHKYSKAGKYTVTLTVTNAVGSNTVTKTNYITVVAKPVASFTSSVTSGKVPLKVTFTDTSTGIPAKWKWDFGDGSKSFHQNPTHKYSKAGVYTVSLTVKNAKGSNTVTKINYIKVITKPVASFTSSVTSGKAPLNVKFTDKSTGTPTKWKWNFGDGATSSKQNPTHKYSKAGVYTVSLTVTNAAGSNTKTVSSYLTVKSK